MFPSSCECSNSTDDDGDECMFVETTDQSIYSDVSYFLQLINVSARLLCLPLMQLSKLLYGHHFYREHDLMPLMHQLFLRIEMESCKPHV